MRGCMFRQSDSIFELKREAHILRDIATSTNEYEATWTSRKSLFDMRAVLLLPNPKNGCIFHPSSAEDMRELTRKTHAMVKDADHALSFVTK